MTGMQPIIELIWLVVERYPSEKYEFVNWDVDIPNIWENKIHVPNHQPARVFFAWERGDLYHDFHMHLLDPIGVSPRSTCSVKFHSQSKATKL